MLSMESVRNWVRSTFTRSNSNEENNKSHSKQTSTTSASASLSGHSPTETPRSSLSPQSSIALSVPPLPVLTDDQKRLVRVSWQHVNSDIEHFGSVAMLRLFEHKMDFKKAFKSFRDMPIEDLRDSPLVKMHAMSVLHVVEQLVNRLDQPQSWPALLNELCRRHVGYKAIPELAPDVAESCWEAMKPILEQHGVADPETKAAWYLIFTWLGLAFQNATEMHVARATATAK